MLVPCDLDGTSAFHQHHIGVWGSDSAVQVGFILSPPWSWRILNSRGAWGLSSDSYFLISLIHSCGYDLINLFVSCTLLSLISARKSGSSNVRASLRIRCLFWLTAVPLSSVSLSQRSGQRWLVCSIETRQTRVFIKKTSRSNPGHFLRWCLC